ncbi:glutamine--scyllo-inositol aminotransferase [Bacillus sp. FJAT-27225]|uniref:DegT/DnrJ/EryC1/StrS family aminotransferase n=1 Tax=Bacillus sp. FJAT-27225 TaxID=1743144 RepID=UPI00080C2389|nr:DegT/DnrJ/EryC1/StrS family aminotransferase [Bacillus sp. FJAT-27225]OCA85973.1 glutamine--scyllo-inositol aminotransferase [Bacillus sp. FJAT-27225]
MTETSLDKLAISGGSPVRTKPFPDWPIFGKEEEEMILEVVRSGKWGGTNRNKLPELERKFADLHQAAYAISTVNGTLGITVALQAAGVNPGDEVIMPPYTFIATATAALIFGAIPVFVDVEEDTLSLDPEKIEEAITSKTKAILPVHIAGAPANMTEINRIAKKHQLVVIEDAAQAVGAEWEHKRAGALGDLASFSFQSGKNITSGEGGMILSNNKEFAEKAWSLANVGRIPTGAWYQHERIGWNLRMSEFQAAILLAQLTRLEEQCQTREHNAALLNQYISHIDGVTPTGRDPRVTRHAYHMYMFRIEKGMTETVDKQDFIRKMNAEGIPVTGGYVSLNQNRAVINEMKKWLGKEKIYNCPVSETACEQEIIWLPQRVLLGTEEDMDDIARAIKKVMNSYRI